MNDVRVAILVDNQVIAYSDNVSAVRVSAAMIASTTVDHNPITWPISEGQREAMRQIAMAEV
jgi:hypothetical protein